MLCRTAMFPRRQLLGLQIARHAFAARATARTVVAVTATLVVPSGNALTFNVCVIATCDQTFTFEMELDPPDIAEPLITVLNALSGRVLFPLEF